MNATPKVSFVIPCYNYGRYLPDCLASILGQQDSPDFEIVAVDDASTDNTDEVLAAFADSRLRVVRHPQNLGHVATVNEGLALARGEFVARIDPDDRYRPHFLSTLLPKFLEFPEIGLAYGDAAIIDENGQINAERSDGVHHAKNFKGNEFILLLQNNCICAPTAIARREAWMSALPIPAGLAFNDWYFNIMMARRYEFFYTDAVVADYRVHAHNHHTKVIRDKSEEPSIFRLLDQVYGETERSDELERAKLTAKGRIYGTHYLVLANKYFWMGMNDEARRCYWAALRNHPIYAFDFGLQRRLAATIFGRQRYEAGKAFVKRVLSHG